MLRVPLKNISLHYLYLTLILSPIIIIIILLFKNINYTSVSITRRKLLSIIVHGKMK